jgi:hypothetical protein
VRRGDHRELRTLGSVRAHQSQRRPTSAAAPVASAPAPSAMASSPEVSIGLIAPSVSRAERGPTAIIGQPVGVVEKALSSDIVGACRRASYLPLFRGRSSVTGGCDGRGRQHRTAHSRRPGGDPRSRLRGSTLVEDTGLIRAGRGGGVWYFSEARRNARGGSPVCGAWEGGSTGRNAASDAGRSASRWYYRQEFLRGQPRCRARALLGRAVNRARPTACRGDRGLRARAAILEPGCTRRRWADGSARSGGSRMCI